MRLTLAATMPVLSAETYYWLWSQHLAWGYLDHPPGIAVTVALGDALLGPTALGLRLGTVMCGTAFLYLFQRLCERLTDRATAFTCLVIASLVPFGLPLGVLALPDGPLLLFWTAALLAFHHAVTDNRWTSWLLAGACTGLAILSKYNGFQLPLVFLVFLLSSAEGRARLRSLKPWVALGVALVVVSPNLAWNLQHDQAGAFSTPFMEGLEPEKALVNLLLFAVLPILALTPVVAWLVLARLGRSLTQKEARADPDTRFLLCGSLVPLGLFALVALVTRVHAHWVATAFVTALPLAFAARNATRQPSGRARALALWTAAGGALLVIAAPLLVQHDVQFLIRSPHDARWPEDADGVNLEAAWELAGDDELRTALTDAIATRPSEGPVFLTSTDYHLVARAAWLLQNEIPALPMRADSSGQFAVWSDGSELIGGNALWIESRVRVDGGRRRRRRFARSRLLPPVQVEVFGQPFLRYEVFWCDDFRGVPGLTPGIKNKR